MKAKKCNYLVKNENTGVKYWCMWLYVYDVMKASFQYVTNMLKICIILKNHLMSKKHLVHYREQFI